MKNNTVAQAQLEEKTNESSVLRSVVLALSVIALILAVLAFRTGRDRVSNADSGVVDLGADAYDLVVTAPTEPTGFVDTSIWALPSQAAALFPSADDLPTLRIASTDTGALVGLERPQGLVALASVPPGLQARPTELLISPTATVLTLVGLHPDITTSDADTYLARLIVAAQTPEVAALAGIVDGERSIASWGRAEQVALQRIVSHVLISAVDAGAACPDGITLAGPITRCGDTVHNTSSAAVLIADGEGQPCALVPGATQKPSDAGRQALQALIADGVPVDPAAALVDPAQPGTAPLGACGELPQVFVESTQNPLWATSATQFTAWADDITPIARILGADIADTPFPTVNPDTMTLLRSQATGGPGTPTPAERVRAIASTLQVPQTATQRGLLPLTNDAVARLQGLTDLLAGVFQ